MTYSRLLLVGLVATVAACRGQVSEEPPVHLIPDMDWQPKYDEQGSSAFFADGRAERPLVEGTVARGSLHDNEAFDTGKEGNAWVNKAPVTVDEKLIRRGEQRFNIFCAPCHGRLGDGNGMIVQRGFPAPPSYHTDRLRQAPIQHFYDVITNGYGAMYSYAQRVPPADRWAIIAYIRALQASQDAKPADVPENERSALQ